MKRESLLNSVRIIVVLVVAISIALLLITLRPKAERRARTDTGRLVEVLPVKADDVNMIIETYGTVEPRETLNLVAEVRGQVVDIHGSFKEGSFFEKGTRLIAIDPRTFQFEVERRKIQIDQADAELNRLTQEVRNLESTIKIAASDVSLAEAEFSRLKSLISKNVVAQTTLDKTEQRYLASLEQLQQIKNQLALTGPMRKQLDAQRKMAIVLLREAELDLERTEIEAPFDGWVIEKAVEKGQHVTAGQYLGKVYSEDSLDIEVGIPVKDLEWLSYDFAENIMPEAEILFNSADTLPAWKGRVTRIMARMDEKTRTLPVVVEVNPRAGEIGNPVLLHLRPGMFVTVKIMGKKIENAFVLPRYVVHDGDVVYVVQDNRLVIKPVNVLRSYKESVYIDKGLENGDRVVKTPLSGAVDGMLVRLKADEGSR
ncbi:MAG: efflux RND transporter periplasmic adaptor subunit [Pseudomonadota bacterium]